MILFILFEFITYILMLNIMIASMTSSFAKVTQVCFWAAVSLLNYCLSSNHTQCLRWQFAGLPVLSLHALRTLHSSKCAVSNWALMWLTNPALHADMGFAVMWHLLLDCAG